VKEGATLSAPELAALGIEQIRIVPAKSPIPNVPAVVEERDSVKVSGIVEDIRNWYRVSLLNVSNKGIRGIYTRQYRGRYTNDDALE